MLVPTRMYMGSSCRELYQRRRSRRSPRRKPNSERRAPVSVWVTGRVLLKARHFNYSPDTISRWARVSLSAA